MAMQMMLINKLPDPGAELRGDGGAVVHVPALPGLYLKRRVPF